MISTQKEEVLRVFNFVGQQQTDCLQWLLPPVHIVTQKEVITLWGEPPIFKKPQQIIVLPMDITWEMVENKKREMQT